MAYKISVILTDHPRGILLDRLFQAYAGQTIGAAAFELLFLTGDPVRIREAKNLRSPFSVKIITDTSFHSARLKNRAVLKARGRILLFLSAKVLPSGDLLAGHAQAHDTPARIGCAYTGIIEMRNNGYAPLHKQYLSKKCAEFHFIKNPGAPPSFRDFNLYQVSILKSFLGETRFDERFSVESYEGMELAYRLQAKGLQLLHRESLRACYNAEETAVDFAEDLFSLGAMAVLFNTLVPESVGFGSLFSDPRFTDDYFDRIIRSILAQNIPLSEHRYYNTRDAGEARALLDLYDTLSYSAFCLGALRCQKAGTPGSAGFPPKCSIIILTFNNRKLSEDCLNTLFINTDYPRYEVIVVDNGSTDGTREMLERFRPLARLAFPPANLGFARGCNLGAALASGHALLFLNNDTRAKAGWLSPLMAELQEPGVGMAGSRLLYPDNTLQHAGVVFASNNMPYHLFQRFPADYPQALLRREYQAVTAACCIVGRDLFQETGGFDEGYVNGLEDVDLCLKIRAKGKKIMYNPQSTLFHLEGQSSGRGDQMMANRNRFSARWGRHFLWDDFRYYLTDRALPRDCPDGLHIILTACDDDDNGRLEHDFFQPVSRFPFRFRFTILTLRDEIFAGNLKPLMPDAVDVRRFTPTTFQQVFQAAVAGCAAKQVVHKETRQVFYGNYQAMINAIRDGSSVVEVPFLREPPPPSRTDNATAELTAVKETFLLFPRDLLLHAASTEPRPYPEGLFSFFNTPSVRKIRIQGFYYLPFDVMVENSRNPATPPAESLPAH